MALLTDSDWAALPAPNVELLFSLVNQVGQLPRRPDGYNTDRLVVDLGKGDFNSLPVLGTNHQPRPLRNLGSNASRSPSPRRLKPTTEKVINKPGKIASQGALSI